MAELQLQEKELLTRLGQNHPDVRRVRERIAAIREQIETTKPKPPAPPKP